METLFICLTAFLGSALTLFSGFGLGTLLVPVFGLFFPIDVAIAMTAIVHFLNNLFKLSLLGRRAHWGTVLRFGLPSLGAALLGAWCLRGLTDAKPLIQYGLWGHSFAITPVKLTVAALLFIFSLFELVPRLARWSVAPRYLPLGGLVSGFFGGLSGNQGALRSAFLIRVGLSKESFIATGVVIACLVDVSRLSVYAGQLNQTGNGLNIGLIVAATVCAFAGAYLGNRFLRKVTIRTVQVTVASLLIVFAVGLAIGII